MFKAEIQWKTYSVGLNAIWLAFFLLQLSSGKLKLINKPLYLTCLRFCNPGPSRLKAGKLKAVAGRRDWAFGFPEMLLKEEGVASASLLYGERIRSELGSSKGLMQEGKKLCHHKSLVCGYLGTLLLNKIYRVHAKMHLRQAENSKGGSEPRASSLEARAD